MPAAIPAVIAAATAASVGTTIFGLSVALSATLIGLGSFALNTLGAALSPKPKGIGSASQTQQVKQPVTERRIIYGECKVSGPICFFTSTAKNKYLHIVLALATHQSNYLGTTWFNDDAIHPDDLDANGNVIAGKYAGKARIKKHLGQPGQIVDGDLLAECSEITNNFVGNGITYIYVRLEKSTTVYKSGLPNIQQWVQGALLYDPRTSTSYWSPNSVLALRDYMTHTRYGVSVPASKFPSANVIAGANSCDEIVNTVKVEHKVKEVTPAADTITIDAETLLYQTGDRVQVVSDGTLPGGISALTNYYVIVHQPIGVPKIKLASTYANALSRTAIDITSTGSGQITVNKNGEPRYTSNGTLGTSAQPKENITSLLSAMAGDLLSIGGKWIIKPAVWQAPTIEIKEKDMFGSIEVQTKHSRRERFNAVQGLYVAPLNFGEPTDYPLVKDITYLQEDGTSTVPVIAQLDQPLTSRSQQAQRVARIQLNRHRRQRTAQLTTNLSGLQLQSADPFYLTHSNNRYNQKQFEVADFNLVPRKIGNGMALTCDLVCSETDSAIYDFDESVHEILPQPPQTVVRINPDFVEPPGAPSVTEVKYVTADGNGVKVKAEVAFSASPDAFAQRYQLEYKLKSSSTWLVLPLSQSITQTIFDIAPGDYDIRVKTISIFLAESDYSVGTFNIIGLTDLPATPVNFSIISLGGDVTATWEQTVDIDVRVSGWVRLRHTPDLVGYNWSDARDITEAVPGIATSARVPLLQGVYMAKFVDSTGNESATFASIIMDNISAIQMNALASKIEHAAFSGTKTNMIVSGGVLRLDGAGLFDSTAGNFDAAAGLFDLGAGVGQQLSGRYDFSGKVDCGKVIRAYAWSHIKATIYNSVDLFDSRTGAFDSATGLFDGADITGIRLRLFIRTTDDDPNGVSPSWREWQPFIAGYFTCRGYQWYLEVTSEDPSLQTDISELAAYVDVPDVTDSAKTATSSGALATIPFAKTFVVAPDVNVVINDAQPGDQLALPLADITSSNFKVGVVNSGLYVVRNIIWFARGY